MCDQIDMEKECEIREVEDLILRGEDLKNYEPRLNQEWVQILINLRMKHSKSFTRKRHSASEAWKIILLEMIELGAPSYVTIDKIKKKWMNLIARYKLLKFSASSSVVTWPYYDQIDRAYSRNPQIVELRKPASKMDASLAETESDESFASDYADSLIKKQKFTSILIQLRFAYRHLFTGKKYAAQRGWMVIQNMLPDGQSYSIEQISKCWQNLVQRYRTLLENEKDYAKISWVHFHKMHEIMVSCQKQQSEVNDPVKMAEKQVANENKGLETLNAALQDVKTENQAKEDAYLPEIINKNDETLLSPSPEVSSSINNNCNSGSHGNEVKQGARGRKRCRKSDNFDIMQYFAKRDAILQKQHQELLSELKIISGKLG